MIHEEEKALSLQEEIITDNSPLMIIKSDSTSSSSTEITPAPLEDKNNELGISKKYTNVKKKRKEKADNLKRREFLQAMTIEERTLFINKERAVKAAVKQKMEEARFTGMSIVIDLSYEEFMCSAEIRSLALQLNQSVSSLKKMTKLVNLNFCPMVGKIKEECDKMGLNKWIVNHYEKSLAELEVFKGKPIIYLSPDGPEELTDVQEDCVYVIGGLVDKSVKKNASLNRAKALGIKCCRLPIKQYVTAATKKVLNIDTIVRILHNYLHCGSWEKSLLDAIPTRMLEDLP
jgi:tRNA (guanine9-N1)-methyltransferase